MLKKLLLSLLVFGLSFIGFSIANLYTVESDILNCETGTVSWDLNSTKLIITDHGDGGNYNLCFICENNINGRCGNILLQPGGSNTYLSNSLSVGCNGTNIISVNVSCRTNGDNFSLLYTGSSCPCGGGSCPTCPECEECEVCTPQYTSSECQSEYNLIPISDIDSNYCTENDLCTFTGSYSNLVINDIWHESKPFIYVNIPEEIDWDYTGNSYSFTLDVGGYNTDSDYIAGIITTQKSIPDSSDFQSIVRDVLPLFVPGFVIILFLYYIFRLIKKLF